MVALLHPARPHRTFDLHTADPRTADPRTASARGRNGHRLDHSRTSAPPLRLVVDNTVSSPSTALGPSAAIGAIAVIVMVILVVMIRGVQGAPPAATWAELSDPAPAPAASTAGESPTMLTVTVQASDTWASIAARVAPESDPIEFARQVAMDNGGYSLAEGQVLSVSISG